MALLEIEEMIIEPHQDLEEKRIEVLIIKKERIDVALLEIEEMIVELRQDLEEMKMEVLLVKKESIDVVLLVTEEMTTGLQQTSEETITKALTVKKIDHLENLLDLKKNLAVVKKNYLINFQKNPDNL